MVGERWQRIRRPRWCWLRQRAFAGALAVAMAGGALPALAASPYSASFIKLAGPLQTAIAAAKQAGNPAGMAALKDQFDAAVAVATTPDEQFAVGNFGIQIGSMTNDNAIQYRGIKLMLNSGKASPELLPKLHFYAGNFAYEAKDFVSARTELQAAIAAGLSDPDAYVMFAETYFQQHEDKEGLPYLERAIALRAASGAAAPDKWYLRGLGAAYAARDYDRAVKFGTKLVSISPEKKNWSATLAVLRDLANAPAAETLDLLRLMAVTDSFAEERDYAEFITKADARANPAEVKAVIEQGVADRVVDVNKPLFAQALTIADGRLAADKASLPDLERAARAQGASLRSMIAAADALLSYGAGERAGELYQLALAMPGVDQGLVLTRWGIAQVYAGDYHGAQAHFAQVTGTRAPLAQLWLAYIASDASGAGGAKLARRLSNVGGTRLAQAEPPPRPAAITASVTPASVTPAPARPTPSAPQPAVVQTAPRLALVIGNSAYGAGLGSLSNPARDAELVAGGLRLAGFTVDVVQDADQRAMKQAIQRFGQKLGQAGKSATGLFYYAGHGAQSRGINYLIPVHAALASEADLDLEAVQAEAVLTQMAQAQIATSIVILDACRDMPLPRSFRDATRGLSRMDAPGGSYVAYSTAPGQTAADGQAGNSPFAQALVAQMAKPDQPIEILFRAVRSQVFRATNGRQTPWDSSSLFDSFVFTPSR